LSAEDCATRLSFLRAAGLNRVGWIARPHSWCSRRGGDAGGRGTPRNVHPLTVLELQMVRFGRRAHVAQQCRGYLQRWGKRARARAGLVRGTAPGTGSPAWAGALGGRLLLGRHPFAVFQGHAVVGLGLPPGIRGVEGGEGLGRGGVGPGGIGAGSGRGGKGEAAPWGIGVPCERVFPPRFNTGAAVHPNRQRALRRPPQGGP
jgi:hypothetical protein